GTSSPCGALWTVGMERPMTEGAALISFCGIIGRCSPSTVLTFNSVGTDICNSGPITGPGLAVGGTNSVGLTSGVPWLPPVMGRHELATTTPPAYCESAGRNAGELALTATTCRSSLGSSATARGVMIRTGGGGAINDRAGVRPGPVGSV